MAYLYCARCSAALPTSVAETVRCAKCGAVHHGDGTVISPVMTPAYDAHGAYVARLSPWQLPHTRPLMRGQYECRFASLVVRLWWADGAFRVPDGRKVDCRKLTSWRGGWAL